MWGENLMTEIKKHYQQIIIQNQEERTMYMYACVRKKKNTSIQLCLLLPFTTVTVPGGGLLLYIILPRNPFIAQQQVSEGLILSIELH